MYRVIHDEKEEQKEGERKLLTLWTWIFALGSAWSKRLRWIERNRVSVLNPLYLFIYLFLIPHSLIITFVNDECSLSIKSRKYI